MYDLYLKFKYDNGDKIIIIKNGEFYYVYNDDAFIINYLFKYKLVHINDRYHICFPFNSLSNIKFILKNKNIGYITYDGIIKDISFGDSEIYNKTLIKYYDKKCRDELIEKISLILENKSIDEVEKIYCSIK